jgi:hypothetical protein
MNDLLPEQVTLVPAGTISSPEQAERTKALPSGGGIGSLGSFCRL